MSCYQHFPLLIGSVSVQVVGGMEWSRSGEAGRHYSRGGHGPGLVPAGQSGPGRTSWPERPQCPDCSHYSERETPQTVCQWIQDPGERIAIGTSRAESSGQLVQ